MAMRITDKVERQGKVTLTINDKPVEAYDGETLAAVLFAEQIQVFYRSENNQARGVFCNMGSCFECLVRMKRKGSNEDFGWVRTCMTTVEQDMLVETGRRIHEMDAHEKN